MSAQTKQHKLFWGSSYDRGLDILLYMWPDIKEKYPDAELHVCYGWELFDIAARTNPERRQWKAQMERLLTQKGVHHHGRVGKKELAKIRQDCGIWAYPTYFTEINCITALDAQADGLVPVVINLAALKETVGAGVKVDGEIRNSAVAKRYQEELINIMGDKDRWKKESAKAREFAKSYQWEKIAKGWTEVFEEPVHMPKVTIVTPTIRQGWWNVMANNIASQTYKNIEWLIVDGFEKDRSAIAAEYAEKYGINIRYVRDKKRKKKRYYGLVNANNTAWRIADGELLVWLQDFVLMPTVGIEALVDIYRHHPNDLIAPVDRYYHSAKEPDITAEDWYNGDLDIVGDFYWENVRVQNKGIRYSDNPYDFEANYGAIPKRVLEKLNGWWEFMDDGLGHDNTEIALRAMEMGSRIIVDDTNIAVCIDHWKPLKGTKQNMLNRARKLNPPRYSWLVEKLKTKELPLVRNEELDEKIDLTYEIPEEVSDDDAAAWVQQNHDKIVQEWLDKVVLKKRRG